MISSNPRPAAERYDACSSASRSRAVSSRRSASPGSTRRPPWRRASLRGSENDAVWPSNAARAITSEPNPYALRSVRWIFGVVAPDCAANIRAPLRRTPGLLRPRTREHAGVVGEEEQRQVERVCDRDEVRGLVGGVGVDRAGHHIAAGWRRSRPEWPPSWPSAEMTAGPNPGCTSNQSPPSTMTSRHGAHVVDPAVVAGHDRQQLGRRTRAGVSGVDRTAGRTMRSPGSTKGTSHLLDRAEVVGAPRCARDRSGRPPPVPRVLPWSTSSPDRLAHHGRPGREDRRLLGHDREVGDRRDQRAVARRRAHHPGHHRHLARAPHLHQEVVIGARGRARSGRNPAPSSIITSGILLLQRLLGEAQALGVAPGARSCRRGS